jgi:penicillin-binding protein 1A
VRTLLRLVATIVVAALGVTAVGVAAAPEVARLFSANTAEALPLPDFSPLAQRSLVYDQLGNVIDILKLENREPFTIDKVPQDVKDAVLAVEDEAFYRHKGVNAKSLVRAMLANVSAGEVTQGGSTITQQLVKNALLTSRRDADRKMLEAALSVRLEREYTKDEILERYLNTIYLGNNAYGLQAAAEVYFGKNVDQLTLEEGAFLAGLIRNPVGYDPIIRPENARSRYRQVMKQLVAVGKVTSEQGKKLAEEWPLPERLQRSANQILPRSYFTDEVKNRLLNKTTILGEDYQQRYNALFRGGLKIYTTLNPFLQAAAEQARNETVPSTNGRFEVALTSLDTKTGAVRAMVGGPNFEQSQVNLAMARRQTGSSIKLFILAAAIQAGVLPTDQINGTTPCSLPDPNDKKKPFEIREGEKTPLGPLDEMTWRSNNCAYARLSQIVGLNRVVDTAKRMGVDSQLYPYASFATGANETSTLDMASGFQTLANQGLHKDAYFIERIEGPDGKVIYQHDDPGQQVLDPGAANTTISVLKGVISPLRSWSTGSRARLEGNRPAAGKTGTQQDNTNAWFVGGTPQFATAVWMGDPNGYTSMDRIPEYMKDFRNGNIDGGTYPAVVWKRYMDTAHAQLPVEDWPKPPATKRRPARVYLPGEECVSGFAALQTTATTVAGAKGPTTTASNRRAPAPKTGTTVPPNVLDPLAPVPSVPANALVYNCASGPPKPPAPKPTTPTTKPGTKPGTTAPPTATTTAPTSPPTDPPSTPPKTEPPAPPSSEG